MEVILGSMTTDMADLWVTIIPANQVNMLHQSLAYNLFSE